jgi:diaminopimelate decarboxylase
MSPQDHALGGIARRNGHLYVEGVTAQALAERFGTPLYAYSRSMIEQAYLAFEKALGDRPHMVCYAMKANSNLGVLSVLARLGAGFDIVSGGELKRVLAAGGDPKRIVFSGVGKSRLEMQEALSAGIACFNVESASELEHLAEVAAKLGVKAPVSLRINPDVDAGTHPYISTGLRENKFGIGMQDAMAVYRRAAQLDAIAVCGIDCHIGSQLTSVEPYRDALRVLINLVDALSAEGIELAHIDVGGGQGICYDDETPLDIDAWAAVVTAVIGERKLDIIVEPGRFIVGPAGVLLTRVEYLKQNDDRHFAVVDAAMNDLIRPALYSAWQKIVTVSPTDAEVRCYDVVGPVCESADFLGKQRELSINEGDVLAVKDAGAYAAVMASNYNTRPRGAEVLVDGDDVHVVRERELTEDLFASESLVP